MRTFVADNPDEVRKFRRYGERVSLLLRVSFRSPGAVCDLSRKFGCDPEDAIALARLAASLGIDVQGFSFHVGSQAADALKHVEAIEACRQLLGGGAARETGQHSTRSTSAAAFPSTTSSRRSRSANSARRSAPRWRKLPARACECWPEPGRYIAGPAAIGVATVMGRARREGHWWYYLDDGLYGGYSGQLYDHARYPVECVLRKGGPLPPSVLAGPTCDSIDVIAENLMLPQLKAGDLIVGRAMGAYTWASASEFNFFPKPTVIAVNRRPGDSGGPDSDA